MDYDYYVDPTHSWTYRSNHRWDYNDVLKVNESTKELILYFITTATGKKYNKVRAGNNITNITENSTNTTNVVKMKHHPEKGDNGHRKKHNDTGKNHTAKTHQKRHRYDERATGNPLFALILVLISLGALSLRRKN
jgi:hypothetical protein